MTEITIPYNWKTRPYQRGLWKALNSGTKRAVAVWHRRAGKDSVSLNWTIKSAIVKRPGVYWHMLPTQKQARKVIWDGMTKDGRRVMDFWPEDLIKKRRDDEMKLIVAANGGESIWQLCGSDNYDSLLGANPVGVIFSEYSLTNPAAWEFVRPILTENEGWALFIYTARGRNHGYDLYKMALDNPSWFCERLTIDDTGSISKEAIEEERKSGMSEEMIQQEFYCSFDAPLQGSFYGTQMLKAAKDGRICSVPHDPAALVETWWDLGIGDATAIWFAQRVGKEIHLIDYYEDLGEALSHYVAYLHKQRDERGYNYSDHVLPHDVKARELSVGKSREAVLRDLRCRPTVLPLHKVEDGIEQVRNMLSRCWFDEKRCAKGIEALRNYRKEEMPEDKWLSPNSPVYKDKPLHDWSSHGADAFRCGAMHRPKDRDFFRKIDYGDSDLRRPRFI